MYKNITGSSEQVADYNAAFTTLCDDVGNNTEADMHNEEIMFDQGTIVHLNGFGGVDLNAMVSFARDRIAVPDAAVLQLIVDEEEAQNCKVPDMLQIERQDHQVSRETIHVDTKETDDLTGFAESESWTNEFNENLGQSGMDQTEASSNHCKCMDKIRNKIDYFQKRVLREMADFRHETTKSIRKLTEIVVRMSNAGPNTDSQIQEVAAIDALADKYKAFFPVADKNAMHSMNNRIESDADFKMFMEAKLEKICGIDATKTIRKILKACCTVACLGQFSWLGTSNKDRFCKMENFIGLMAQTLENRFPNCDAFSVIETVVKQRTKSAGEAMRDSMKGATDSQGETLNQESTNDQLADSSAASQHESEDQESDQINH